MQFKVALIGGAGVGKTAISHRFAYGLFASDEAPTIGASYVEQTLEIEGHTITLNIWDTAGQERYAQLVPMYFRNAPCVIIVFDVSAEESYKVALQWYANVKENYPDIIPIFAGNKCDLPDYSQKQFIPSGYTHKVHFVSAKTGEGIKELFEYIGKMLMENYDGNEEDNQLDSIPLQQRKSGCC
ncbi:Rab1a [Hexamita inflata]|uniref:Rab1a n=1 Tax=Hexamita inflata TaxID=28002 RepID=A0AA86QGR3_9EUKA|nr:Rab1a [Hexamita inflata]